MEKQQFEYVGLFNDGEEDYHVFGLGIPLTDDGCPDSTRVLRVTVSCKSSGNFVEVILINHFNTPYETKKVIADVDGVHNDYISDLLYGAAEKQTIIKFVPKVR